MSQSLYAPHNQVTECPKGPSESLTFPANDVKRSALLTGGFSKSTQAQTLHRAVQVLKTKSFMNTFLIYRRKAKPSPAREPIPSNPAPVMTASHTEVSQSGICWYPRNHLSGPTKEPASRGSSCHVH